jgi:UDP-N-acetyl-D-mannosaminuronate dehydrogenase
VESHTAPPTAPILETGCELIETDITTAELAKYGSNAFLALKISFVNALARLCERAGADVLAVADVMGKDPRIGPHFLNAGLGYGGSCFPKDLVALQRISSQLGYDFPLLGEVAQINDQAIDATLEKIRDAIWKKAPQSGSRKRTQCCSLCSHFLEASWEFCQLVCEGVAVGGRLRVLTSRRERLAIMVLGA